MSGTAFLRLSQMESLTNDDCGSFSITLVDGIFAHGKNIQLRNLIEKYKQPDPLVTRIIALHFEMFSRLVPHTGTQKSS